MVVGVTGGIGSGKSTVLKEFKQLNIPVYIADVEAKKIMNSSVELRNKIILLLGNNAYVENVLNRAYVASKVFNNKDLLNQLNKLVHPAVQEHFKTFVQNQTAPYVVYENAILYENKFERFCDKVIVVTAPEEDRIKRVVLRDGISREEVLARMKNQWSQEEKVKKADFVIENKHPMELQSKVRRIHKQLLAIKNK